MAKEAKQFQTNMTGGEFSDLIGARPDFQKYFNGLSISENGHIYPEGGWFRRPGLHVVAEVKDSNDYTILVPFEFNVEQAYIKEFGNFYARTFKPNGEIVSGEVATIYPSSDLPNIQYRQSADVLFMVDGSNRPQRLNRFSDTNWSFTPFRIDPVPSEEMDTDISLGGTLTPGATTGTGITFTSSTAVFLEADEGREIRYGASLAAIRTFTDASNVVVEILEDFPNTNSIPSGEWLITGSPVTTLDPDAKEPKGAWVNFVAAKDAFRASDVGKYIKIWGGLAQITTVTNAKNVFGLIKVPFSAWTQDANPTASPAGAWSLETALWSNTEGWPSSIEFHQGRLYMGKDTMFAGSVPNAFDNFGVGDLPDDAVHYALAARKVNHIQSLISLGQLFVLDAGNEHVAKGQGVDAPLGGDSVPFVKDQSAVGTLAVQAIVVDESILIVNRSQNKVYELSYAIEQDSYTPKNKNILARQIGSGVFAKHPAAYAQEPNSVVYYIMENGQLACLTYNKAEEVTAWTRLITDGSFESVAVIPVPHGFQVWVIVRRTIGGVTKRFIEYFDDTLNTDCAAFTPVSAGSTTITGYSYLNGKTVDVKIGGYYIGQYLVTNGTITHSEVISTNTFAEVGLHYRSRGRTMRPAVQGQVIEGTRRRWSYVVLRLKDTIGGTLNGQRLGPLSPERPYTGIVFGNPTEYDYDGFLTFEQNEPYPFTVLGIAGEVKFSEVFG